MRLLLVVLNLVALVFSCEHHSEESQYTFNFAFNVALNSFNQDQANKGICSTLDLDLSKCSHNFINPSAEGTDKTNYQFTIDGHSGRHLSKIVAGDRGLDILSKNVGYECDSWYTQKTTSKNVGSRFVADINRPLPTNDASYPQLASIPSNFDTETRLFTTRDDTGKAVLPSGGAPDVVGAFRFICYPGHLGYDDPIVFPGQPGKSHLHQFFGNTLTNAFSTYSSLRTSGNSTCNNDLNRSAYWIPAMLDGKGNVVKPDYVSIYYKRFPVTDPNCFVQAKKGCIPIPRGLRYVFGYDLVTNRTTTGHGYFNCDGPGAVPGNYKTITEAAQNCPPGCRLGYVINAPHCWDGKNFDSPNHRDHMANVIEYVYPEKCPDTHPYLVPTFTLGAWFSVGSARADSWYLSSDVIPGKPTLPPGTSLHADWFGAWDDETLMGFEHGCIDGLLNCASGNLGNYHQMLQVWKDEDPKIVPMPPKPVF